MARRVFFSFHYQDVSDFRANVVRNSWRFTDREFYDSSIWEKAKTKGEITLKNLINNGIKNTSVTAVLIGGETHDRRWVKYEIFKSFEDGNGLLGIYINRIRDKYGRISSRGFNPFDRLKIEVSGDGKKLYFYELVNRRWNLYSDLSLISNKRSNSFFFEKGSFFNSSSYGKSFRLSELFPTYCWVNDNRNLSDWVEQSARNANR